MRKPIFLVLVGILALGGFLRFYKLGDKGFWWDEVHTIELAKGSDFHERLPVETVIETAPTISPGPLDWSRVLKEEFHPPLFYIFMNRWLSFTDSFDSDAVKRIPSAFFGTLSILLIFILGTQLHTHEFGLLSALLFALSPFEIYESQELRRYTLFTSLVLISYISLLSLPKKKWALFTLVFSLTVMMYTHYMAALMISIQGLLVTASPSMKPCRKKWVIGLTVSAFFMALYLPKLLPIQLRHLHSQWNLYRPLFPQILESFFSLPVKLVLGSEIGFSFYAISRSLQLLLAAFGVIWFFSWLPGFYQWLKEGKGRVLLLSWIGIPIFFFTAVDIVQHSVMISGVRYFGFISPAVILLLSFGLWETRGKLKFVLSLSLISLMAFVLVFYYKDPVRQKDFKRLSYFIKSQNGRDLIILNQIGRPSWVAPINALCLVYYHATDGHPIYLTGDAFSSKTQEIIREQRRFWLVPQNKYFSNPGYPYKPILREEFKGIGPVVLFENENQ